MLWQPPVQALELGRCFQHCGLPGTFLTLLLLTDRLLVNPAASPRLSEQESIACLTVPVFHQQ